MEVPRFWRDTKRRLRFVGEICQDGHPSFYPRAVCPDCSKTQEQRFVEITKMKNDVHFEVYASNGGERNKSLDSFEKLRKLPSLPDKQVVNNVVVGNYHKN